MSRWVCQKCGTINSDPLDNPNIFPELIDEVMRRRKKYEDKGEIYPLRCEMCRALRIQD